MKVKLLNAGTLTVDKSKIWCSEYQGNKEIIELYAMNGTWNVHLLQLPKKEMLFGGRNIMIAFSHEKFPVDIKKFLCDFYAGDDPIGDKAWGSLHDFLWIDTGKAVFCTRKEEINELYQEDDMELRIAAKKNGICLNTGFGDGKYEIYTFVKQDEEHVYPMMIVADFMIFSDEIEIE